MTIEVTDEDTPPNTMTDDDGFETMSRGGRQRNNNVDSGDDICIRWLEVGGDGMRGGWVG